MTLKTQRLILLETPHFRQSISGKIKCVLVNAWMESDVFPSLIVGTLLLVELPDAWLISHLLIEDESRNNGFATEIIRFYEDRLGKLSAAWVSDSGEAFARRYAEKFGPRPHWQIGKDPEMDKLLAEMKVNR